MKVLFFDSGIGGLNVLKAFFRRGVFADFYYLSDPSFSPYGDKCAEFLFGRVNYLIKRCGVRFDAVVLACNTLSTLIAERLEQKLGVPVFGIYPCEPKGKTLLLCTPSTAASGRVKAIAENKDVTVFASEFLAGAIEKHADDILRKRYPSVIGLLPPDPGYERVIVGCTHYLYLAPLFKKIYRFADIVDGTENALRGFLTRFGNNVGKMTQDERTPKISKIAFLGDNWQKNSRIFLKIIETNVLN